MGRRWLDLQFEFSRDFRTVAKYSLFGKIYFVISDNFIIEALRLSRNTSGTFGRPCKDRFFQRNTGFIEFLPHGQRVLRILRKLGENNGVENEKEQ